jgi:hypothetical protein
MLLGPTFATSKEENSSIYVNPLSVLCVYQNPHPLDKNCTMASG